MGESSVIGLVGIGVGFLQGIVIYVLSGIKRDISSSREESKADVTDLWSRIYGHYHEIHCDNRDCTALKTGNVIIPGPGGNGHG